MGDRRLDGGLVRLSDSLLQLPLLAAGLYGLVQVIPFGTLSRLPPSLVCRDDFARPVVDPGERGSFLVSFLISPLFWSSTACAGCDRIAMLITIFGTLYAFFAILQSVLSPDKIYGIYERAFAAPFGSFVSRHNFAAYIEMTIAIPLGLLFTGSLEETNDCFMLPPSL